MIKHLRVITQSAIRAFRKCPRYYMYNYNMQMKPVVVSEALDFGSKWHDLRDIWWNSVADNDDPLKFATSELVSWKMEDEFKEARLFAMLCGYHHRWFSIVTTYDILGIEQHFEVDLINPRSERTSQTWKIQGKFDAVIRDQKDGRIWICEEKTASGDLSPESAYWRRLEIDPQCSIYFHAASKVYNEEPAGIRYFVNVKPQLKPLQINKQRDVAETPLEYRARIIEKMAESPEKFYVQTDVPRLENDIRESSIDVWDSARAIRDAENSHIWLRNPDACVHPFGSVCSYLPVCANRAQITDPTLYRKAETPHEELTP